MNHDQLEMTQVQAAVAQAAVASDAASAGNAARMDLYSGIHKALRAWMASMLCRLGSVDSTVDAECSAVVLALGDLLDVMHGHLVTENTLVHPVIEARFAGALRDIEQDHQGHELAIARLRGLASGLLAAPATQRPALALHLYREFALFMAENITHMQVEETRNQQLLWDGCTDAELMELHERIIAAHPPHKMMAIGRWMIPAMNHPERVMMLAGMRAGAPAEFFAEMLQMTQERLDAADWDRLCVALGLLQSQPQSQPQRLAQLGLEQG